MPPQRGELYFVDLSPGIGREQQGRRPVVVVSRDDLNRRPLVVLVVPGTRGVKVPRDYPQNVRVPAGEANLPEETVFLTFQARALDHSRFRGPPEGVLGSATMAEIGKALMWSFDL